MTHLYTDALSIYNNSTDLGRFWSLTGTASVSATGGPYNEAYMTALGSASEVVIERTTSGVGTPKQIRLRFYGKMDKTGTPAPTASSSDMLYFLNTTGAVACSMTYRPSIDTMGFYRGSGSNLIDDEIFDLDDGVWHHFEVHMQIGDSDGAVRVWVDEVLKLTADNVDTDAAATSGNTITGFGFKANRVDNSNYVNFSIANVAIDDGTFASRLGRHRMTVLHPTADDSVQFTRSTGSDSYALIDEQPYDAADYVQSSTLNQQDTYVMENMPYHPGTIWNVAVFSWGLRSSGTSCTLASVLVSGATTDLSAGTALGTTLNAGAERFDLDPNGSIAWTGTNVDALKSGHKLTATTGSGVARVYSHALIVLHSLQQASMAADVGSFVLSGQAAALKGALKMAGDVGSFVLSGQNAALKAAMKIAADVGTFVLSGQNAALKKAVKIAADVGTFVLTGLDVSFIADLVPLVRERIFRAYSKINLPLRKLRRNRVSPDNLRK